MPSNFLIYLIMRIFYFFFLTILCLVFSPYNIYSHSGKIAGIITDINTQNPIAFVNVILLPLGSGTSSDENGEFSLDKIPEGQYELKLTHLGYQSVIIEINIIPGEIINLKIEMEKAYFNFADVLVTSKYDPAETFGAINDIDTELRPINTSQDVLRIIPGLVIAQHGGGGKAEQIFLRGFDNDHGTDIDLKFDGMPVNMVSHAHGQGYSDLHFIIPELIGRVDFGKGPYYADKGNFNTGGYAEFKSLNKLNRNQIKIETGEHNTFRTVGLINILSDNTTNQNAYIAAEHFYTDGYFDLPQNFNRVNLFAKYTDNISDNIYISLSGSSFSSKWDQSGQIPQRAVDNNLISRFGAIDLSEG
ncbi:MAG: TonB-dependent receptor, partial [Melioribacteraceae bacterium]|nr:TonB-dependent receptor [Melioribacteraceae bacterium]